jgi:hypothetical protein
MVMTYYDRSGSAHDDGTRVFQTQEDRTEQSEVARVLSDAWDCKIHSFGELAPIDWYAVRHGRLIGLCELKRRHHDVEKYETVFLNLRKWLALICAESGVGVRSVFVVKWNNATRWILASEIDASMIRIGGCSKIVKSVNDIEPCVLIPVDCMKDL